MFLHYEEIFKTDIMEIFISCSELPWVANKLDKDILNFVITFDSFDRLHILPSFITMSTYE